MTDLRDWRRARGWTQTEAATAIGCSLRQWQYWEDGSRAIPLTAALALAELTRRHRPSRAAE